MKQRIRAAWKVLRGEYKAIPRECYPSSGLYAFNSTASSTATPAIVWNAVPPR